MTALPAKPCQNNNTFKKTRDLLAKYLKLPKPATAGFTLVEIIVVITVIGILSAVLISSINAQRHLGAGRNVKRKTDTYMISLAIYNYFVDREHLPNGITTTPTYICHTNSPDCTGMVDLMSIQRYMATIPTDPSEENPYSSGYTVQTDEYEHIIVNAPHAENGEIIVYTR